ncbi:hypothetical protein MK805_03430 [Shimazuella sp. AN120528]|uniref:hypothetical protein n=1 Tax=Shimazuella soli TaxID=1892854 RepID=UPI001F0F2D54|nr:hypothetical protein [Shimazuella soli]MCH5584015.1 hypothetical protein [Shimazuella soli]
MVEADLVNLCKLGNIPSTTFFHQPTRSAAETQAVLPKGCLVQKTITCKLADKTTNKLVLWTGVADFRIHRSLHREASQLLNLKRIRSHTFNPKEIEPLQFYGVPEGTVNPFLSYSSPATRNLDAIFFLPWPSEWNEKYKVAISLSLQESLIISLSHLKHLLWEYQQRIFPDLHVFELSEIPSYMAQEVKNNNYPN